MVAIKGQPGRGHSVFNFGRSLLAFTKSVYDYVGALTQELVQQVAKGMVLRVEIQGELERDPALTSRFFEEIGGSSTVRLNNLNLSKDGDVTDHHLEHLAKGCPSLQQINLVCCYQVTDTGRAALRNSHPNIQIVG